MSRPHNEIILDSIADGVFTVDADWIITSFNRAAERITGVSREQAIGQKCFDVFHANICQSACALRRSIETGNAVVDQRIDVIDAEGRRVPISISTAVLQDREGRVIGGVETFRDLSDVETLRKQIHRQYTFGDIISKNPAIHRILEILPDIAASTATVLIEGASGTGKELVARAVHDLSARAKKPFVAVNCGALPEPLLESELFGYKRGAFTGAVRDKPGRFALADGGTLLLDEIGDVTPAMQVKLLRVLQEKQFEPLGATASQRVDVRVIAATHRSLSERVAAGQFREDLYYRLKVIRLRLPPLAERREDIPLLAEHFMERLRARTGKQIDHLSPEAIEALMQHDFPGNVRELENVLEHAFILCRGRCLEPRHLPAEVRPSAPVQLEPAPPRTEGPPLARAEAAIIREALRRNRGNRGQTAEELRIDKSTLWRKMRRYGIAWPREDGRRRQALQFRNE